jgi:hypothetical protein
MGRRVVLVLVALGGLSGGLAGCGQEQTSNAHLPLGPSTTTTTAPELTTTSTLPPPSGLPDYIAAGDRNFCEDRAQITAALAALDSGRESADTASSAISDAGDALGAHAALSLGLGMAPETTIDSVEAAAHAATDFTVALDGGSSQYPVSDYEAQLRTSLAVVPISC